jgi:hypothetical protein
MKGKRKMIPEKDFWNNKYSKGGISGRGSIGKYRNWKWGMINQVIGFFNSVVDVGCGDLSFWQHPIPNRIIKQKVFKYTGIDISDNIIKRNRAFAPKFEFICNPANVLCNIDKAQVVLCLDLLFHIMDDFRFELILDNLCKYSDEWIVIYTWEKNPFELQGIETDGVSQYFRRLNDYRYIFDLNDFEMVNNYFVPFDDFGMIYFFRKLIY